MEALLGWTGGEALTGSPKRFGRRCVYCCIIGALAKGLVSVRIRKEKLARRATACICLLAVALLYAPFVAATLVTPRMDCCSAGFCPARGRHHKTQQAAAPQDAMPMDCGHDMNGHGSSEMSMCSISCCQSPEHPTLMPGAFVLPNATLLAGAGELVRSIQVSTSEEISRFSKPLSPPPRGASVL
jgi:hypothetical protein